jgi:phosphomannomutase
MTVAPASIAPRAIETVSSVFPEYDSAKAKLGEIRAWAARNDGEIDELDGLTVSLPDGRWFNVRSSNTEPLLRLNVEAADQLACDAHTEEVLELIRAEA